MDRKSGLDRLRTCLFEMDETVKIENLVLYKCGTKKHITEYALASIETSLYQEDYKCVHDLPVVVKCFVYPEIYVAWHTSVGIGNGKYFVSKSDLEKFENHPENDYKEIVTGDDNLNKVYFFRNASGIKKFFTNALKIEGLEK